MRALRAAFVRAQPFVEVDTQGYVRDVTENLLPTVSLADFEADLRAGDGNELERKFKALEVEVCRGRLHVTASVTEVDLLVAV